MRLACALLLAAVAAAAAAGEPNVIDRVELRDAGAALVLEIHGSRPPSFTTFASESPARFVVEVAGAELRGVEAVQARETGPVSAVRAELVPGEGAAKARVAVAFRGAMEGAEVATRGHALVVTFPKAAPSTPPALAVAPAVVAAPAPAPKVAAVKSAPAPKVAAVKPAPKPAPRIAAAKPAPPKQAVVDRAPVEPPQVIREFGFRQLPDASRVYVRTAGAPRFAVEERDDALVLTLGGARPSRAERPLDTSFFRTAVARVVPRRAGGAFVLEIALREKVGYRQHVEGDLLAVDFELPAGAPAAGAPAP